MKRLATNTIHFAIIVLIGNSVSAIKDEALIESVVHHVKRDLIESVLDRGLAIITDKSFIQFFFFEVS